MNKEPNVVRRKRISFYLNDQELKIIAAFMEKTCERTLANYLRKVGLQKPLIGTYRNLSMDDFLREMLELKKILNSLCSTFQQAAQDLHILEGIPEFRRWLEDTEEIRLRMNQLYEQWLPK